MKIELTVDDLDDIVRILAFTDPHSRNLAAVGAQGSDGTVTWAATDQRSLASVTRGNLAEAGAPFGVPSRELLIAHRICRPGSTPFITIVAEGSTGTIYLPQISIGFSTRVHEILEILANAEKLATPDREVEVSSNDLLAAVDAASLPPTWLDESARKLFWLQVDADRGLLTARSSWTGHRDTVAVVRCRAAQDADIAVDPHLLRRMVVCARQQDVRLAIGPGPLWLKTDDGVRMLVMPQLSGVERLRPLFERALAEIYEIDSNQLARDADGDYPFKARSGRQFWIRLVPADPLRGVPDHVSVFTVLAQGVEASSEALKEINTLNTSSPFVRLFHAETNVYAFTDLMLEEIDRHQLQGGIETIAEFAERTGLLFGAYFGATEPPASQATSDEDPGGQE